MKNESVWLVVTGEYSDHRIIAAFSTRELADAFCQTDAQRFSYNDRNSLSVEECQFNPEPDRMGIPDGYAPYQVIMSREGDSTCNVVEVVDVINKVHFWPVESYYHVKTTFPTVMVTWMLARDEVHAVKIANERRVQILAAGTWGA